MKNILITGISGYIGTTLARALVADPGVETIVGTDVRQPSIASDKLHFFRHDVREPMTEMMSSHRIDTVVHAAYILPPLHDTALMESINVDGTRNVLEASARAGVRHLLVTSSATAYGFHPDNPVPLTEASPLRGNEDFTYAKNKREIEAIIRTVCRTAPANRGHGAEALLRGGPVHGQPALPPPEKTLGGPAQGDVAPAVRP